jgi:hypothetical protein
LSFLFFLFVDKIGSFTGLVARLCEIWRHSYEILITFRTSTISRTISIGFGSLSRFTWGNNRSTRWCYSLPCITLSSLSNLETTLICLVSVCTILAQWWWRILPLSCQLRSNCWLVQSSWSCSACNTSWTTCRPNTTNNLIIYV